MSLIDDAIEANKIFARDFGRTLGPPPRPRLAVLTCIDPRLSRLEQILGVDTNDMHVIRNGGPVVTEDAIRSLIFSTRVIGTKEILILGHTECGFYNLREAELKAALKEETGNAEGLASGFFSFTDVYEHTRSQVRTARSHPWISAAVPIRGAVIDMETGEIREVAEVPGILSVPLYRTRRLRQHSTETA
jgi:carbonic anhydrase